MNKQSILIVFILFIGSKYAQAQSNDVPQLHPFSYDRFQIITEGIINR